MTPECAQTSLCRYTRGAACDKEAGSRAGAARVAVGSAVAVAAMDATGPHSQQPRVVLRLPPCWLLTAALLSLLLLLAYYCSGWSGEALQVQELARQMGCSPATLAATTTPPPPQRTVYVITPTYRRPEQLAELTRLAQTLMHVPALHWLVVEEEAPTTALVSELLASTDIPYDHLVGPMPEEYKNKPGTKARGVSQRNRGLQWIRANATTGVLYFGDDDNAYNIRLFEEMRSTERVAMWPVGLVTDYGISTPVVADGKFKGFYDGWIGGRKFPVDMAGFAVSVEFLLQRPNASMPYKVGFEEDRFLKSLAPFEPHEIELKANNCTKVLVWHTQTKKNKPSAALDMKKYNNTNLVLLKKIIV
ncbi:galactosylgalactosylxylosylprotein 3-beta-glucuronosyltransferase P-like [Schistocerca serialis cubense]|uniref:galactosylgalactosylxylosylprotein 3-beta-glucuronosyltransferase P-like n=1 Tax=Schistocerca serialis cubense TaxID=2023355 RepID=UPI00214E4104|nr:galactosylgalactosylxylosylprotein 3-beta-glucuronosyltransferase P-like [Schistocerca serialis cubense]